MHFQLDPAYEFSGVNAEEDEAPALEKDDEGEQAAADDEPLDDDDDDDSSMTEPATMTVAGDRLAVALRDGTPLLRPAVWAARLADDDDGDQVPGFTAAAAARRRELRRAALLYAPAALLALIHAALQIYQAAAAAASSSSGPTASASTALPPSWSWRRIFALGLLSGSVVFTSLLYFLLLSELGIALSAFHERLQRLVRFSSLTERGVEKALGLPRLRLDCPSNIKLWNRLRDYLLTQDYARKVYFEIVLGFLILAIGLSVAVTFASAFLTKLPHAVGQTLFHTVSFGTYVLVAVAIAAEMDRILKSHIKLLHQCQWKLEKKAVVDAGVSSSRSEPQLSPASSRPLATPPSGGGSRPGQHQQHPTETIGTDKRRRRRSVAAADTRPADHHQQQQQQRQQPPPRMSPFMSSPPPQHVFASPSPSPSPGTAAYGASLLLSRLVTILEDEPGVKILGMRIDYSFLFKISSYVAVGMFSSAKNMIASLGNNPN